MLELKNITKEYPNGDAVIHALDDVSVCFRKNEFVSILGPSGCGKTTLLNIVGGLDRYTSGDLCIGGVSTKEYRDRDWDSYRNHSVGFVFQSYNLIPHQTVLSNVELALTLSGVSKKQRRARAIEVLQKVGLGDQLYKRPNQMSGGQMQRVAIARALVNDPAILLADEPTGALDSESSLQVMELLKEVAKDRLVIMVTHNPELAEQYSTRIVKLRDGRITHDSMPYDGEPEASEKEKKQREKKPSMSFFTALSLSFNNLMTKKARTILIAFAGSIGIIGIALILSLSNGVQLLIDRMEQETLSSYPLTLEKSTIDFGSMLSQNKVVEEDIVRDDDHVYSINVMSSVMDTMLQGAKVNNLSEFKAYIESGESGLDEFTSDISYVYSTPLNIYRSTEQGNRQVNPNQLFNDMGMGQTTQSSTVPSPMQTGMDVWVQLIGNEELLSSQYDLLAGDMPKSYNEVVLIVDKDNQITDFTLYSLGLLDADELKEAIQKASKGEEVALDTSTHVFANEELVGLKFKLLTNSDLFAKEGDIWVDKSQDLAYMTSILSASEDITVVGIIRPSEGSTTSTSNGVIGYRADLMTHLISNVNSSAIVLEQKANPDTDIFTGLPFDAEETTYTMADLEAYAATQPAEQQAELMGYVEQMRMSGMEDDAIATQLMSSMANGGSTATFEGNLLRMGAADLDDPDLINLYPIDFEAKDQIAEIIAKYNEGLSEEEKLTYTDYIGLMISSITVIINAISYILIAFVAVSLVVSSIMIGIITYISVLERTRDIGVLRSIGASKRDIARVFNAETLTIGTGAGLVGIGITAIMLIPINAIIETLTSLKNAAVLPTVGAIILIGISMLLTFFAGLIPAFIASKKDPVVALRTE